MNEFRKCHSKYAYWDFTFRDLGAQEMKGKAFPEPLHWLPEAGTSKSSLGFMNGIPGSHPLGKIKVISQKRRQEVDTWARLTHCHLFF